MTDTTITFRCSPEERALWQKHADADDRTLSKWITRACDMRIQAEGAESAATQPRTRTAVPPNVSLDHTTPRKIEGPGVQVKTFFKPDRAVKKKRG